MSEGQEPMNIIEKEPESSKAELEPKRVPESKPVGESKHVPTEPCKDDSDEDIEPLSGKPFFHIELLRQHVGELNYMFQLVIPAEFARTLPKKALQVSLTRGGRTWEMNCVEETRPNYRKFDHTGWKAFAKDNKLKTGDVCIFELMESSDADAALKFKVQVLRGDFPSALLAKQDGGTSDNPIVVD